MFSEEHAARAERFFERVLQHTKGEWAGKPFDLLDWQRDLVRRLFGTLNEDGTRQYRTCYLEVARKNGKSELAAGIALYLLFADGEEGAEVYSAAGDRDQAGIVYNVAAEMIRRSSVLSNRCKIIDSMKRVVIHKTASVYRVLSAEAASKHGYNPSGIVFDELHVQPNRDLWDVLRTGTGTRRQPLTFAITTAGYDRNSICYELHDYAQKVNSGVIDDPSFLGIVYSADESEDWTEPAVWAKANPSLGVTIKAEYLEGECQRAQTTPAYENTFRRLFLNQWTRQETRWLPLAAWDECGDSVDADDLRGRTGYAGLDLASSIDIAALVLVFPDGEYYDVLPFFWIPEDTIVDRSRRDRVPYDVWERQGYVIATPGNVIDYKAIKEKVRELAGLYDIQEIAYDRWGMTQLSQDLIDDGANIIPMGQGYASMSPPTKELLKLVLGKKLRHGNNPVLRWMADNMVVTQDPAGNLKPDKGKSTERIDGLVALIMALDRATRQESTSSVYDDRGLVRLSW